MNHNTDRKKQVFCKSTEHTEKRYILSAGKAAGLRVGICVLLATVFVSLMTQAKTPSAAQDVRSQAEKEDAANSFRFEDGEPVLQQYGQRSNKGSQLSGAANSNKKAPSGFTAWGKNEQGQFISSNGEVIPGAKAKGIDVSEHNGVIDWDKVKASEVDFAIIRCGYGQDMTSQDDKKWEANVTACEAREIPYGVYIYSYALNPTMAVGEANHVLRLIAGRKLTYPVYYDLEDAVQDGMTAAELNAINKAFCDTIRQAGYEVGVYANLNWFTNKLTGASFAEQGKWVAQYNIKCDYPGAYDIWQCTSTGSVSGISTRVDLNFRMTDLPEYGKNDGNNTYVVKVTPPPAVTGLVFDATSKKKITVSWKKVKGAAGYTVYGYDTAEKKYVSLGNVTTTSMAVTKIGRNKLASGTKYKFRVAAYKMDGKEYVYGVKASVTGATKPEAPALKALTRKGYSNLQISWKKVKGVKGYIIYSSRKKSSGYKQFKKITKNTTKYKAKNMVHGVTIYFKVKSYIKVNGTFVYSGYSKPKKIKLKW